MALNIIADLRGTALRPLARLALLAAFAALCWFATRSLCAGLDEKRAAKAVTAEFFAFFALYLALLLYLTLLDETLGRGLTNIFEVGPEAAAQYIRRSVNLNPLHTVKLYINAAKNRLLGPLDIAMNLAGNLAAFMPFAFFLPLLSRGRLRFFQTVLASALCVAAVEALQLVLMTGYCDVDDLILNTAGVALAYALLHTPPVRRAVKRIVRPLEY